MNDYVRKKLRFIIFSQKTQKLQTGPLPIYLKITVDGAAKELSAKRKCPPSDWSSASGRAIGKKESVRELNHYLDSLEQMVFQAKRKLIEKEEKMTVDAIKAVLTGTDEKKITIMQVFKTHNQEMKALEGIDFAANTIDRYETTLNHTATFIRWKYYTEDLDIKKLDYESITQFCFWFKSVQKCNHNSTMKYFSNFKKIVLICVKNRWLPEDPFANFKFTRKPVERIALTESELEKIAKKTLPLSD